MAVGLVLVIAGAWVLARTVRKPEGGRSLVDVLTGTNAPTSSSTSRDTAPSSAASSGSRDTTAPPAQTTPHAQTGALGFDPILELPNGG